MSWRCLEITPRPTRTPWYDLQSNQVIDPEDNPVQYVLVRNWLGRWCVRKRLWQLEGNASMGSSSSHWRVGLVSYYTKRGEQWSHWKHFNRGELSYSSVEDAKAACALIQLGG